MFFAIDYNRIASDNDVPCFERIAEEFAKGVHLSTAGRQDVISRMGVIGLR